MRFIPTQPWTVSFIREWWPRMSLQSVLKLRDYELRSAKAGLHRGREVELRMKSPIRGRVSLREVGSDFLTFNEVVKEQVYKNATAHLETCETMMDLGANIGLTSLYFAHRYPKVKLFAVEPNPDSYQMLTANLKELIDSGRCRTLQAAVWGSPKTLVADPSQARDHFSAFATKEPSGTETDETCIVGLPIQKLIDDSGFSKIDLLKVDIEGAEVELFKGDLNWLHRVRTIAIEFHNDSRQTCQFDEIMRQCQFHINDENAHTVLAVKENGEGEP